MNTLEDTLLSFSEKPIALLDTGLETTTYVPLDLSVANKALHGLDITVHQNCQLYIDKILEKHNGQVAFGGYLEERALYSKHKNFTNTAEPTRNIHLGMDFWCPSGVKVLVPLHGRLHSFKNNTSMGDYGPTIILEHHIMGHLFYTLYGHLSVASLANLEVGTPFDTGAVLGYVGTPNTNVGYAPHLHFQIIKKLDGKMGDYPGVCAKEHLEYFTTNCPNPNLLLKISDGLVL